MRDFLTVFSYTFFENARKKAFIISSVIVLLLTVISLSIPGVIRYFSNTEKGEGNQPTVSAATEKKGTVYIEDSQKIFAEGIVKLTQTFTDYNFKVISQDQAAAVQEEIKKDKKITLMEISEKEGVPYFKYWVRQRGNGLSSSAIRLEMKNIFTTGLLKASNVSDATIAKVKSEVSYDEKELGKEMLKSYISSILIIMLLFFAVYFYGYGVAMSVASEKTSRVMEILLTSTKPAKIILGKSAAMGLLGLAQLSAVILAAAVTYKISFPKDFTIMGQSINFSSFTPASVILIVVYFMLGYSLYAMMNAVAGATVSKAEDLNSSMMPISLITMVAFYLAYGSVGMPDSTLSIVSSIVPFSAPFSMPSRLLMTDIPLWQLACSLLAMAATILFMAWVSIRLYSNAVLHYGKRLKLNELVKISK